DAIKNALNSPLLEVEWKGATGALIHITGGPDMSLAEANGVGEKISEKMSTDANVIWGARVDPRLTGNLRVMLILTGVKSPQLLARSKEENVSTSRRRRLADLGVTGSAGSLDPRKIKAEFRSIGKVPTIGHSSWEERLKPPEKRLDSRATEKRQEKKRSLDDLGLRRLS
ncbi:MAG: hypothetical protein KAQ65_12660, partial [Candidatus Thorarchaeota archaeon]|nr:hypothetical protein [Candidatus Thorarchaeota archaeon]